MRNVIIKRLKIISYTSYLTVTLHFRNQSENVNNCNQIVQLSPKVIARPTQISNTQFYLNKSVLSADVLQLKIFKDYNSKVIVKNHNPSINYKSGEILDKSKKSKSSTLPNINGISYQVIINLPQFLQMFTQGSCNEVISKTDHDFKLSAPGKKPNSQRMLKYKCNIIPVINSNPLMKRKIEVAKKDLYELIIMSKCDSNFDLATPDYSKFGKKYKNQIDINLYSNGIMIYKIELSSNVPLNLKLHSNYNLQNQKKPTSKKSNNENLLGLYPGEVNLIFLLSQNSDNMAVTKNSFILLESLKSIINSTTQKNPIVGTNLNKFIKTKITDQRDVKYYSYLNSNINRSELPDISKPNIEHRVVKQDRNVRIKNTNLKKNEHFRLLGNCQTIMDVSTYNSSKMYFLNEKEFKLKLLVHENLLNKVVAYDNKSTVKINIFQKNQKPITLLLFTNSATDLKLNDKKSVMGKKSFDINFTSLDKIGIVNKGKLVKINPMEKQTQLNWQEPNKSSKHRVDKQIQKNLENTIPKLSIKNSKLAFSFKSAISGELLVKSHSNLTISKLSQNFLFPGRSSASTSQTQHCQGSYMFNKLTGEISCSSSRFSVDRRVFTGTSAELYLTPVCQGSLLYNEKTGEFSCRTVRSRETQNTYEGLNSVVSESNIDTSN